MKKILINIITLLLFQPLAAQLPDTYEKAYDFLNKMLENEIPPDFTNAVFATENAYYDGALNTDELNEELDILLRLTKMISSSSLIDYNGTDKDNVIMHSSLFKILTDSIAISLDSTHIMVHLPYTYDFDDVWGETEWSQMFVSKLLASGTGNCHSLPYLYKILSDELGIPCYLAYAPNHIYIKLFSEMTGWYNTELTSATFPVDAWIMASGYINTEAICNNLYMDTVNTRQAIANCLVDLAHGYRHKYGNQNPDFIIKCCNTALKYHKTNANAILTKAEAGKSYIQSLMKEKQVRKAEDLFEDVSIKKIYMEIEKTYADLYRLGYRRIPEKMYMEWIGSLKNEPNKYPAGQ
ncbi:MAG: hypothetical protein ACLSC9_06605 [Barnesiella sp.]